MEVLIVQVLAWVSEADPGIRIQVQIVFWEVVQGTPRGRDGVR